MSDDDGRGAVAQWSERSAHNGLDAGSIPAGPTDVQALAEAIRVWYREMGFVTGGLLHLVLDDCNVHDLNIRWCVKDAETMPIKTGGLDDDWYTEAECRAMFDELVARLLALGEDDRLAAIEEYHRIRDMP